MGTGSSYRPVVCLLLCHLGGDCVIMLGKSGTRVCAVLTCLVAMCLLLAAICPATAFAEGDQVHGDKGQGTVSRWGALEEPWVQVALGVVAIGLAATLAIVVARRRR